MTILPESPQSILKRRSLLASWSAILGARPSFGAAREISKHSTLSEASEYLRAALKEAIPAVTKNAPRQK
jgi:hypothetical protein